MTNLLIHEMIDVPVHEMMNHLMVMTNHKTLIHHYILVWNNLENVHILNRKNNSIKKQKFLFKIFFYLDTEELIIENLDNDFLYQNFLMMLH